MSRGEGLCGGVMLQEWMMRGYESKDGRVNSEVIDWMEDRGVNGLIGWSIGG